jgi:hypothetical protein
MACELKHGRSSQLQILQRHATHEFLVEADISLRCVLMLLEGIALVVHARAALRFTLVVKLVAHVGSA